MVAGGISSRKILCISEYTKEYTSGLGVSWPISIGSSVCRWCATCHKCQLVNPPDTPKKTLCPLPLIKVPLERIGMDFFGPLEQTAQGHPFKVIPLCNISTDPTFPVFPTLLQIKSIHTSVHHMQMDGLVKWLSGSKFVWHVPQMLDWIEIWGILRLSQGLNILSWSSKHY